LRRNAEPQSIAPQRRTAIHCAATPNRNPLRRNAEPHFVRSGLRSPE